MTRTLFITGTDTGVGKTVLTALLAGFLQERGEQVAALKPICSGGREDAQILHAILRGKMELDQINPWHYRAAVAPLLSARQEGKRLQVEPVLAHIREVQKRFSWVLVEGAGGLLSPLGTDFDSRDLLTSLRATPVIAAPNQLGVVNHILLTLAALRPKLRAEARVILMAPAVCDSATGSNADLLRQIGVPRVCQLPHFGEKESLAARLRRPGVRATLAALTGLAG